MKIMNRRFLTPVLLVLSILTAQTAYAQASYAICTDLGRDLSLGSRNAEVTKLQNFLVAQNYPGGGSWMITGYFGAATRQAVLNFQSQKGIASTGIADAQTRSAIRNLTCSGTVATSYAPAYALTSYAPAYTYNNNLALNSLSVSSGAVGTSVTIYGSGFDPVYNNVYFGNTPLSGNFASNGASITFTVPVSYTPTCAPYSCYPSAIYTGIGTYPVYVTNARGTSNSLQFTVNSNGLASCAPSIYGGCGFGYNQYGFYGQFGNPNVSNIYPTSGAVGSTVTVLGSGFSARGNSVHFGSGIITGATSPDGKSLSFAVPSALTGYGNQSLTLGTYNVSVTNETGATSNAIPFTVTSLAQYNLTPTISLAAGPTVVNAGAQGTWSVLVGNPSNSTVTVTARWGDEGTSGASLSSQLVTASGTQTVNFQHAYTVSGSYTIIFTVSNNAGGQNSVTASVVVSPYGGSQPVIASLSPSQGRVGTLVAVNGGFASSGNTIRFGIGGATNITASNNGTTLYYIIPFTVSPCDLIGTSCSGPAQIVTPGSYPVYITNSAGQSATLNFTVLP